MCLGDVGKTWSLEDARTVILVSSTTGEGEQPENVIKFWRKLRAKTLPADFLSRVKFAQLGLGDTNYNEFCAGPKALNRRLTELGAQCFHGPAWADDGTGLEVVVEPWLDGLWEALSSVMAAGSQEDPVISGLANIQLADRSDKAYSLLACPKRFLSITYTDGNPEPETTEERTGESLSYPSMRSPPVVCTVLSSELLSQPDPERAVKEYYQLVLSSDLQYEVGDTVGVLGLNISEEVEFIRGAVSEEDRQHWNSPCTVALSTEAPAKAKHPPHLPREVTSLEKIFSGAVDIRAVPKRLFLRALLEFTSAPEERERLTLLSSKEGSQEYIIKVREAQLSLLDLLALLPSCRPPASLLLEHLPRLLARPYSLSSCPQDVAGQISWLYTRVTQPRPGLTTTRLAALQPGARLALYPRTSHGFSPPEDPAVDFIMVAAGSGIGPFLAFLSQRRARLDRGETLTGQCWLVFGCRYSDGDFLHKDLLQQWESSGVLSRLNVSFSREHRGGPKYVQDSLRLEKDALTEWLHQRSASFYVCGDAKGMASDVKKVVAEILTEKLGAAAGSDLFQSLVRQKRYREDIWS